MNVVAWILGVVVVVAMVGAGAMKLVDRAPDRVRFGYTKSQFRVIGVAEIAAAAAIIVGLGSTKLEWIAIAAAVGVAVLMMGALMTHARVQDSGKAVIPAAVLLAASALFIMAIAVR